MAEHAVPAVLQVSSAPSRAAYDAVDRVVGIAANRPAGMIAHAAAEQADGTVLIVDIWESGPAMEAFEHDRLMPAFAGFPEDPRGLMPERPVPHPAFVVVRG
jgi:hypothetical protein